LAGTGRSAPSVARSLREPGSSVLLVERLIEMALNLADRVYALACGRIVLEALAADSDTAASTGAGLFWAGRVLTDPLS
jgi:branched-chain amino acid transport system ATP-binding protein